MKKRKYTIVKRNGEVDLVLDDGVYDLIAKVTIENGKLKYLDDGKWTKIK